MAKGGSLIGRADPTITKMAYAAALGNVPVDNSAALETMRDTYKSMLDKSGEIFKQIETDKIAMDQDIQSMISPLLDELEDGTLTDPAFEDTKAQIQAFSTEAENILKSREYRRGDKSAMLDFNRRFNTYVNGIKSEKEQLEALATNLEGQAYNVTATKGQELQKGILKFYRGDEDSGVTRTFRGNKAYYTMNIGGQEVTKSLEDIADGIIPKDVKTRGKFDTDLQVVGRSAAKGEKFDAIGAKKTAETLLESSSDKIKTLQDFFHTEHRGQTGTLAQGLSTGQGGFGKISAQLFTVLNKNGLLQEYDTEKTPGKITKEDFEGKNAAKYMQLVDDITSGKNYDLSKKIASELYADVVAKDEHERLKFVAGPTEEEKPNYALNTQLKGGLSTNTLQSYLNSLDSGTIKNPRDGKTYNVNDNKSWSSEDGEKTISGNMIINDLYLHQLELRGAEINEEYEILNPNQVETIYNFLDDAQFDRHKSTAIGEKDDKFKLLETDPTKQNQFLGVNQAGETSEKYFNHKLFVDKGASKTLGLEEGDPVTEVRKILGNSGLEVKRARMRVGGIGIPFTDAIKIIDFNGNEVGYFNVDFSNNEEGNKKAKAEMARFNTEIIDKYNLGSIPGEQ